ncbi:MAG: acyltransferase [Candidatus Thalassarchaeaceae archaeon]|tara:strand:- start:897 stop:1973 length:1077 start_codon:yes stop_codon:yes gene_type:complete
MRLKHIDRIRAIAVLFMVEVHTAAIVPPSGITVGHPAAFVAAAFGGMAAPMFVTVSGWGMYSSASRRLSEGHSASQWVNWIVPRFALLCLCQILVNILLNVERGGRFEWHTPGVLTLLAISAVICPALVRTSMRARSILMLLFCVSPLLMGASSGPELGWFERVDARGIQEWMARLLWNGTYPVLPWLFYILLGTVLQDLREDYRARERGIVLGIIATSITLAMSVAEGIDWALTSGDAVLTFFPASMPFLVVSGTMVALALRILEGKEESGGEPLMGDRLSLLEPAGRMSLTIYVSHFAVLGVVALLMDGEPRMSLVPAFLVTILHTIVWIPLAVIHESRFPGLSLEGLLRRTQSSR